MPRETVTLDVTIEFDNDETLDDAVEAVVTACENANVGKNARVLSVREA